MVLIEEIVPPPPAPPPADAFAAALGRAEEHRLAKRHAQAIEALLEASALQPNDPRPFFQMSMAQTSAGQPEAACRSALCAVELAPAGHLGVLPAEIKASGVAVPRGVYPQIGLRAALTAFDMLSKPIADAVARPSWWDDKELLRMSERALDDTPNSAYAIATRVRVLMGVGQLMADGQPRGWYLQQRTPAQLRELAGLLKKQASLEPPGSNKALTQVRNAATILEKAMQMEAAERAAQQAAQQAEDQVQRISEGRATVEGFKSIVY